MTDVCFVLMPYAGIERPSIALGLLKASLQKVGIDATIVYANLWFASEIGLFSYSHLTNELSPTNMIGEWTFSKAAFPDFQANDREFLNLATLNVDNPEELKSILWEIRDQATAFVEQLAQYILKLNPRIVACSSTFEQHCASLALLRRLRELNPEIINFMGGANCEGTMGQVTKQEFPWVDFVLSGEGDYVVPAFCQQLLQYGRNLAPKKLPYGVISASNCGNNEKFPQAPRTSIDDLDNLPIPDYDDYFETLKQTWIGPYIEPGLPIETSRGCWWGQKKHCTFCGLNGEGMTYRSKSPERVVEEFSYLSERYGIRKFQVVDNILDLKHINTILPVFEKLAESYTIFYETKPNLRKPQLELLAKAGVRIIQPGIESLHSSALTALNKGNSAGMNVQLLKWSRELGISVIWNYLVGIPGESHEWYLETAQWLPLIFHLQPPVGVSSIRFDRFSPYYEQAKDYGLKLVPGRPYFYVYPLSAESMARFAYYFEEEQEFNADSSEVIPLYQSTYRKPEHNTLQKLVQQWTKLFLSKKKPILTMIDEGDQLRIIDTRPCAVSKEHILSGLASTIYKICDRIQSPRSLLEALNQQGAENLSWHEVKPIMDDLCDRKIILSLDGKFLSLAVKASFPLTLIKNSELPAGMINLIRYRDSIRKQMLQSQAI